jgi:hypothetical protein
MRVESGPADVSIQTTPPRLEIDSTIPRQEMGYYQMLALLDEIVAYTLRQAQRGVADTVAAGDTLARIESGTDAIASLAFERMFVDYNDREFVVTLIPRTPPAIRFTPGQLSLDIRARQARVQIAARPPMITVRTERPEIEVTPAQQRFFVREPQTLDLTA